MALDHPLDPRRGRAPFEPVDDALVLDEDERRHLVDSESFRDLRSLLDVDARDAKARTLLPCEVREQALHAPRGPRPRGAKEDEQRLSLVFHTASSVAFPRGAARNSFPERQSAKLHWPRGRLAVACSILHRHRSRRGCRRGGGAPPPPP